MRKRMLLAVLLVLPVVVIAQILLPIAGGGSSSPFSYYVDPVGGNDSNSGTTSASPWKTVNKAAGKTRIGIKINGVYVALSKPAANMAAWWNFQGSPGNTIVDLSGNGNPVSNGTAPHNATSGPNGYVFAGSQAATGGSITASIVSYVLIANATTSSQQFILAQGPTQALGALYGYTDQAYEQYGTIGNIRAASHPIPTATGGWHCIAYSYSSGAAVRGYLDGHQYFSNSTAITGAVDTAGWSIGASDAIGTSGFVGTIAEVLVYNRLLSEVDVASACANTLLPPPPPDSPPAPTAGLIGRWRSDTLAGATGAVNYYWPDSLGNGNTLSGSSSVTTEVVGTSRFIAGLSSSVTMAVPGALSSIDQGNFAVYLIMRGSSYDNVIIGTSGASLYLLGPPTWGAIPHMPATDTPGVSFGATPLPLQAGTAILGYNSSGTGLTFYSGSHTSLATAMASSTVTLNTLAVTPEIAEVLIYGSSRAANTADGVIAYALNRYSGVRTSWTNHVVFDGNSNVDGNGAYYNYPNYAMDQLSTTLWGGFNVGITGKTTAQLISDFTSKVQPILGGHNTCTVVLLEGENDLFGGATPTQAYNNYVTYAGLVRAQGCKAVVETALPRTGVTEVDRASFNALVLADSTHFDAIVNSTTSPIGTTDANLDTTYYQVDQVHLNATGAAVLAVLVVPVVSGIFP